MIRVRKYEELLIHLSNITVLGWCYLIVVLCISISLMDYSEKLVVNVLKKQAKKKIDYSWMIVPYRITTSVLLFLALTSLLGLFCTGDNDIDYFFTISILGIILFVINMLIIIYSKQCVLFYNDELYISKWAFRGIYKKIEMDKNSIAIKKKNERGNIEIISFFTTDGQKLEIDTEYLSKDDIDNLHNVLQT